VVVFIAINRKELDVFPETPDKITLAPWTADVRRDRRTYRWTGGEAVGFVRMQHEPTKDDIDALVGPATPHFAYQLRARVRELIENLPQDHPVRVYGEEKMELLDRLCYASSKAEDLPLLSRDEGAGWEKIPSSAPASDPLPRQR
jgi:hypothetical protein